MTVRSAALALALLLAGAPALLAQAGSSAQRLGRPYLFVFLAYAFALVLIGGWVISIARRLARIERGTRDSNA